MQNLYFLNAMQNVRFAVPFLKLFCGNDIVYVPGVESGFLHPEDIKSWSRV